MITQHLASTESVEHAMHALAMARDTAREQMHLFSAETRRCWKDLEQEIDSKLEEVGHRMADNGLYAVEVAFNRTEELRRAIDALLQHHCRPAVHSFMTTGVKTCHPHDTLSEAANTLWDADIGALPVVNESGKVLGMITDRDICMAAFTRAAPLSSCSVASTMSKGVHGCSANDSIAEVTRTMRDLQVRRLPVLEPDGSLAGIVTVADVIRYMDSLPQEHPARALVIPTLRAITERRLG